MNKAYQYGILILSLIVWTYFVRWYVILFIALAEFVHLIDKAKTKRNSKVLLAMFILLSFLLFVAFKINSLSEIYLPLGYSVFVFSAISLLTDGIKNDSRNTWIEVYNYFFFFPKAFAGPIDRTCKLIPQFQRFPSYGKEKIYDACKILIFACFCKYVVSDNLYNVDCDTELGFNLILAIINYALAFYFDFYAYSLFAIGFGRLLGIDLSMNFSSPYSSKSFKEFWTRWNITLSSWLKDYIYIPLGGSRKNQSRTALNIFTVFLISAIWHDFTIPFLIWGICHATLVVTEKYTNIGAIFGYRYIVFLLSCILWQLFRIDDLACTVTLWEHLLTPTVISYKLLISTTAALLVTWLVDSNSFKHLVFTQSSKTSFIYKEVCVLAIMLTLVTLVPHTLNFNFFYLRF